jgi:hypothetical protein
MTAKIHRIHLGPHEVPSGSPRARTPSRAARAAARERIGKRLVVSGAALAVAGVALYGLAALAGDPPPAGIGEVPFPLDGPHVWAAFATIGAGVALWIAGSIAYLRGALDADEGDGGRGIA